MTQEEKANAYDKAIERANELNYVSDKDSLQRKTVEHIFPELKEYEDERIRKALIHFIKQGEIKGTIRTYLGVTEKEMLAWLEKKGSEPNWCHHKVDLSNCSEEYCKAYYDSWNNCNMQHSQCNSEKNDVIKCLINGMKFYYEDNKDATWGTDKWSMPVKHIIEILEKQGEQKPAEYEKPLLEKFKQAVYDCAWGKVTCKVEGESQEEYAERWAEQFLLMVRDWADDYIDFTIQQKLRKSYDKGKENAIKENRTAWSEEDRKMMRNIIDDIYCGTNFNPEVRHAANEREKWFKSICLRLQSRWKPSEEQMRILDLAIRCGINRGTAEETTLVSLFNDLKILKE